jgi:hypothetical protein
MLGSFRTASARIDRAEFPVHKNSMFRVFGSRVFTIGDDAGHQPQQVFDLEFSPKAGMLSSVWNVSQATPCGSCTQYLSDFA